MADAVSAPKADAASAPNATSCAAWNTFSFTLSPSAPHARMRADVEGAKSFQPGGSEVLRLRPTARFHL
eukprot:1335912-Pleurochrysis_carterae.AAC.1